MLFRVFMICIAVFVASCFGQNVDSPPKASAGTMLGKTFWWKTRNLTFDTLGWKGIEQKLGLEASGALSPMSACALLAKNGKAVYRLKKLPAISLIILRDLGYQVALCTQWYATSENQFKVGVSGMDDAYKNQEVRTDYLWEFIDTFDIVKPEKTVIDYGIDLVFAQGGKVKYIGKAELLYSSSEIFGTTEGLNIDGTKEGVVSRTSGKTSSESLKIRRVIWDAYIIVDAKKKTSAITSDIESLMDKMKLDMSYPVAEIGKNICK